ncbi:MAG: glycosyltransferase family 2 protein [Rhodothermales bacterium]|nr:glycosyltransferase family 2 protein [Rhodothermales bacterium]
MKDPSVSVIIPNYNHAPFLRRRLESVLRQTYQDFEVILLDDASTDGSHAVIEAFAADPRVRVFVNAVNTGIPGKQWNQGVRRARGEYVWIAESDDYADEHFLERLVPELEAHPTAGLVYCQSWVVDAQDQIIESYDYYTEDLDPARWKQNFFNNGKDECNNYLLYKNTIPNASAVLFRKRTYEEAGYADEWVRYCGDWLLWVKMLMISDLVFVAHHLNYYRWHASALSHGPRAKGGVGPSPVAEEQMELPEIPFAHAFSRWPAKLAYIMGRNALRANRPGEARHFFRQSLRLHPSPGALLFYGSSYLGRPVYQALDGVKSRIPLVGHLAGKLNRAWLAVTRLRTRRYTGTG